MVILACDEFGYKPDEARRTIEQAPPGYIESLIEMRAYARAYSTYQQANGDMSKLPASKLFQLVREIHIDVAQAAVDAAEEGE